MIVFNREEWGTSVGYLGIEESEVHQPRCPYSKFEGPTNS